MQTNIHEKYRNTADIGVAESILRACVHCGFCNATCPTYLELGDERDGPRGRIYLIKQLLETGSASARTRTHLDRCLTCRNCETTCPSGVRYGRLLDFGRGILEQELSRSWSDALRRRLIRLVVPYSKRFARALRLARALSIVLPRSLRARMPAGMPGNAATAQRSTTAGAAADSAAAADTGGTVSRSGEQTTERTMIVLEGCAQAAATPATNASARRVLARLGISLISAPTAGCCGALDYHLGEHAAGRSFMRANIDAWWPLMERGAEAIVITASGCGSTVKDYAELLADDPQYADKARRVAALTKDIVEVLDEADVESLSLTPGAARVALHCPCSLQHAQQLGGTLERVLRRAGINLVKTAEAHLCCGSAGSYSLLQPQLSERLRARKLAALNIEAPDEILTANVGCQLHLASGGDVPVRHWIEAIDAALGTNSSK